MEELLKLAEGDRKVCSALEADLPDEFAMRAVAYHIQQAIEKLLKAAILMYGQTPPFTHDISLLCERGNQIGVKIPQELNDISDTLTLWEAKSRYDPYVSATVPKYEKAKSAYDILHKQLTEELSRWDEQDEPEL